MSRLIVLAALATCAAASQANAQGTAKTHAEPNSYVGIFTGIGDPGDQSLLGRNEAGVLRDIVVDYRAPVTFGANIGAIAADGAFGRLRVEGELSYRRARVGGLSLNDVDRVVLGGSKSTTATGLVNAWYDTPKLFGIARLSAGAGVGLANVDNNIEYLVANPANTNGQAHIAIPDSQTTYAFQFMAGAEVEVSRSVSIVSDLRHLRLGDYQVQRYILNTPGVLGGNGGTLDSVLDAKWKATSITVGARLKF